MQQTDMLIDAGWVLPIAPNESTAYVSHSIFVSDGKIADLLPTGEAHKKYHSVQVINRKHCVVMPGLINAHTHSGMTSMRGRADDQPLLEWLRETVWPIEQAFGADREFCEDGSLLAVAEMIRGGVTCFSDMYFFPDTAARVVSDKGMRAIIGLPILEFPTAYASGPDSYISEGKKVREQFKSNDRIKFSYAPHAPYTVSSGTWDKVKKLSEEENMLIHTHLHETKGECAASLILDRDHPACHQSDAKCHPIEDLNRRGLLSPNFIGAHMVHLTDEEIALCAEKGVHVAHCPTSNAKLASGFCPVHKLIKAGINVAIGTDSAGSNNSLDMLAEIKMTALLAKNLAEDASVVPAPMALRMATINAARAFGIDNVTGSLEVGKAADLVCIEVGTHAGNTPVFDPHSAVVYASSREDVSDVMVQGKFLLRDKKYCTLDLKHVLQKANFWRSRIQERFPSKAK